MPALDSVNASGDVGGDDCFGFQFANPTSLGRGSGPLSEDGFTAFVSKAAILSRKEPDLGLGGVLGESDMMKVDLKKTGLCVFALCGEKFVWELNHGFQSVCSLGNLAEPRHKISISLSWNQADNIRKIF